jgi:hypothetical protein
MAKIETKLYLCLIRHCTMKMDVGVDVELHPFLTWALRTTGFLYYVHRPIFQKTKEQNSSETGSVSFLR